jgi:hypothetical protein
MTGSIADAKTLFRQLAYLALYRNVFLLANLRSDRDRQHVR